MKAMSSLPFIIANCRVGLLSVKPIPSGVGEHQHFTHDANMLAEQANNGTSDTGASHQFIDLDLGQIQDIIHVNRSKHKKLALDTPIKISVHLDKNSSYQSHSNSGLKLYSYQNSLQNYWILPKGISSSQFTTNHERYRNSTIVLFYQHEPSSISVRDCLFAAASQKGLATSKLPINARFRKDWEQLAHWEKDRFQVLYGSLSFGVCEGLTHPCSYLTMLSHPIDRILTMYHLCQLNSSHTFCHFTKTDLINVTLHEFVRSQGSNLFHKLLYYSRHCRLVGDDEVCLEDSKVTFALSAAERKIYLQSVLEHLEEWFSVVGLTQYMELSLLLFDLVHHLNLSACHAQVFNDIALIGDTPYDTVRAELLGDPKVQQWLSADLAIYRKLEEIFLQQLEAYELSLHSTTPSLRSLKKKPLGNKRHKKKLHFLDDATTHKKHKPEIYVAADAKQDHKARGAHKHTLRIENPSFVMPERWKKT